MAQELIRSIGSDGKEVLSNILDKDTGKYIQYKEIDSIPDNIVDGVIYIKQGQINYMLSSYIETKTVNVKWFGAKGDGATDDTEAFKKAFKYNNVYIPEGKYIISDTIYIKTQSTISGVFHKTIIKYTKLNSPLLLANPSKESDSNVFNFGLIQNIRLEGVDTSASRTQLETNKQVGIDMQGFQSTLLNVDVYNFYIGLRIQGVCLDFNNCTIAGNYIGVMFDDYKRGAATTFNTMIDFIKCNIQWNWLGMTNVGYGQTLTNGRENVIGLNLENTVFESNRQGFYLIPFSTTIRSCWFELNDLRPVIWKWRVVLEKNRYESGSVNQRIEWLTENYASEYRGAIEIGDSPGVLSVKELNFQRYTRNGDGTDRGTITLTEGLAGSRKTLKINNEVATGGNISLAEISAMNDSNDSPTRLKNRIATAIIKPDGNIYRNAYPNLISSTKVSEGFYKLTFNDFSDALPHVTVFSPDSQGGISNVSDTFYATTSLRNESSNSDYNSYFTYNKMFIKTYKRPTNGDEGSSGDVKSDTFITLTFYY